MLPFQRSLFILGDVGSERYSLFRTYASTNANLERYWHPEDSVFKQCTWVLFSADQPLIYKQTEQGLQPPKKIVPGETYYISVLPGQLPVNTKLVFTPYFLNEEDFKAYYDNHALLKHSSAFIWFEGFPYGKADTVQQLRYLQDLGISQQQLSIAITQMERNFVITDIGNIQQGIENAKMYFIDKQYRVLQQYAMIPIQRTLLLEALRHDVDYITQIVEQKQEFLENLQSSLMFVDDDIRFALEEVEWIVKLENCFSYVHVKQSKTIASIWIKQLKQLFEQTVIQALEQELFHSYQLEKIQQANWTVKELRQIIEVLWKELEKKLSLDRREHTLCKSYTSQLDYELSTMKMKSTWYEIINYTMQNRLPKEIHRYLESICKKYVELV